MPVARAGLPGDAREDRRGSSFELCELPLLEPFIISGGTMTERRSLVVILHDDEGHRGYGESPPFELPFYSDETLVGARDLLERVFIPRLLRRRGGLTRGRGRAAPHRRPGQSLRPRRARDRGLGSRSVLAAEPVWRPLLAERLGVEPAASIPCGVALGIPAGPLDRDAAPLDRRRRWRKGYRRVKIKVAPGWDAVPVDAARARDRRDRTPPHRGCQRRRTSGPSTSPTSAALDEAGLLYIEQPLRARRAGGPCDASPSELRTPDLPGRDPQRCAQRPGRSIELGGPQVWNIKVHRVGGLTEVVSDRGDGADIVVRQLWAGTMPESGLGSQAALAAASMPGFVYPSDLEPSTRWFGAGKDIIELTMSGDGRMSVPRLPIERSLAPGRLAEASTPLLDRRRPAR